MTLKNAITFFESLKNETTNKSEIKIYDKFMYSLSSLKNREFTKEQIQSIEMELDDLNLQSNTANNKKFFFSAMLSCILNI